MVRKNLTRKNLSNKIYQTLGFSKKFSLTVVDDFFDMLATELIKSNIVKISSFGTFKVINKMERIGRNPKTGEQDIEIPAKKAIRYKISKTFFKRLNKNFTENNK